MAFPKSAVFLTFALFSFSCKQPEAPKAEIPQLNIVIADSFAYPISKNEVVTQAKDKDDWYNALDFGE